jgi:uroporphyrinogen-III synthase
MRLLVTRPDQDGERTAVLLRARGHEVLLAPLLRMQAIDFALADEAYGAVVMTSANAARAIASHPDRAKLTALAAFTVGRHTAEAARAVGFRDVHSADGGKNDLVRLLQAHRGGNDGPLLYLAGEDRSGDLALGRGTMRTVVVYRAVKVDRFPPGVEAALAERGLDGVLHFSRRSAQTYLDCARVAGMLESALAPRHYCLSRQVSEPLAAAGAAGIKVAPRPEEAALIDLVIDLS